MILPVSTADAVKTNNSLNQNYQNRSVFKKTCADSFTRNSQVSFGDGGREPKKYTWDDSLMKFHDKEKHFVGETPEEAFEKLFEAIEQDLDETDRTETAKGEAIKKKEAANPAGTLLKSVFTGGECQDYIVKKGFPFEVPEFLAVSSAFIGKYGFNPKFPDKKYAIKNYITNDLKITAPKGFWDGLTGNYAQYNKVNEILTNALDFMNSRLVKVISK